MKEIIEEEIKRQQSIQAIIKEKAKDSQSTLMLECMREINQKLSEITDRYKVILSMIKE